MSAPTEWASPWHESENEQRLYWISFKARDDGLLAFEQLCYEFGTGIAYDEPDDLGWGTTQEGQLPKIIIFGDDRKLILTGSDPKVLIGAALQVEISDVETAGICRDEAYR